MKQFDGNDNDNNDNDNKDNDNKDKHVKWEKLLYELKIQKEYFFNNQIGKIESQIKHLNSNSFNKSTKQITRRKSKL